jgi:hypothetical protein
MGIMKKRGVREPTVEFESLDMCRVREEQDW